MLAYLLTGLVGLWPVNLDFRQPDQGIDIYVISSPVHADLVIPWRDAKMDWNTFLPSGDFPSPPGRATHAAIGWGDRSFYLHTPTWSDLTLERVIPALCWPTETCLHVEWLTADELPADARRVRLSAEQYARLVDYVRQAFVTDEAGRPVLIRGFHFGPQDAFYVARGSYTAVRTCNTWIGDGLATAGVRVGWYTPWPRTVLWHLPAAP